MDVRVEDQRLSPRVQHAQRADLDVQTAAGDIRERAGSGLEQKIVEDARNM